MTFDELTRLAVKVKDKHGAAKTKSVIQKYAPKLQNVAESDYDKLADELRAMLPQRKTELPAAIAAPYGEQEAETDTTSQQVESLTMKPLQVNRVINTREDAIAAVKELQEKWDLIDDNTVMQSLMEKMEERHGEEFNAFFEATVRQVMLATGLQQVKIDTSAILLSLAQGNPMRVREEPGFLIYELVEEVKDFSTIPDECAASGESCSYRPHGPNGEMQCQYCGKSQEQKDA